MAKHIFFMVFIFILFMPRDPLFLHTFNQLHLQFHPNFFHCRHSKIYLNFVSFCIWENFVDFSSFLLFFFCLLRNKISNHIASDEIVENRGDKKNTRSGERQKILCRTQTKNNDGFNAAFDIIKWKYFLLVFTHDAKWHFRLAKTLWEKISLDFVYSCFLSFSFSHRNPSTFFTLNNF